MGCGAAPHPAESATLRNTLLREVRRLNRSSLRSPDRVSRYKEIDPLTVKARKFDEFDYIDAAFARLGF
jgi:hypothetical protein